MSTNERCAICRKPDLRRLVELGWKAKMSAPAIAACFGNIPSATTILKHLHEHVDEGAAIRDIPVPEAKTMRERVSILQQTMVEEVERRIIIAQETATAWNDLHEEIADKRDWSYYFNILDKDVQASIGSIIKMQGLDDKRVLGKANVGVELYKILGARAGKPPPHLIGAGPEIEAEVKDVTPPD